MMNRLRLRQFSVAAAVAVAGLLLTAGSAFATHFRYATISGRSSIQPSRVVKVRFDGHFAGHIRIRAAPTRRQGSITDAAHLITGPRSIRQ